MFVYFGGDWDVHWGYGILTHGQLTTAHTMTPGTAFGCAQHAAGYSAGCGQEVTLHVARGAIFQDPSVRFYFSGQEGREVRRFFVLFSPFFCLP